MFYTVINVSDVRQKIVKFRTSQQKNIAKKDTKLYAQFGDILIINRWNFIADRNGDGAFTISDVWLWSQWIFFLPGDGLIYLTMRAAPSIANFFELTEFSYGSHGSGVISGIFWFVAAFIVWADQQ